MAFVSSAAMPRASIVDTLAVIRDVVLPTMAKGIFIRRPTSVALAQFFDLDTRAVKRLQKVREKYGEGILLLAIPGRRQGVVLSAGDVRRVLDGAPEPFAPASLEKRLALAHFEPNISLASTGSAREKRRELSDVVLENGSRLHSLTASFLEILDREAESLLAQEGTELRWTPFEAAWRRALREIVFGPRARDDEELTRQLEELRAGANWGFLKAPKSALLSKFQKRVADHIASADGKSLAGLIRARGFGDEAFPVDQVTHWLFASDAGAIATFRALALLSIDPSFYERAVQEADAKAGGALPLLRAGFMESLRLWPTAPAIFRETTDDTEWEGRELPANTHLLIFSPYFHRDGSRLPFADKFAPDLWLNGSAADWPLVPFSAGPGTCPAHDLTPLFGSAMLASILRRRNIGETVPAQLVQTKPLPGTLNHFNLRFRLEPRLSVESRFAT